MTRLDEIRARLAAANPGRWVAEGPILYVVEVDETPEADEIRSLFVDVGSKADAALIANAPADLAYLLAEVERLTPHETEDTADIATAVAQMQAEIAQLKAEVQRLQARCTNDDITLDLNERACAAIDKLPHEALDEACARVRADAERLQGKAARVDADHDRAWKAIGDNRTGDLGHHVERIVRERDEARTERDEAIAALKDVGGPRCECGHEGDLYHYTDGTRGCTAGDCPCVRLRWARPVLPEVPDASVASEGPGVESGSSNLPIATDVERLYDDVPADIADGDR